MSIQEIIKLVGGVIVTLLFYFMFARNKSTGPEFRELIEKELKKYGLKFISSSPTNKSGISFSIRPLLRSGGVKIPSKRQYNRKVQFENQHKQKYSVDCTIILKIEGSVNIKFDRELKEFC
ncbi:MAG: hypothetical protein ABJG68_11840 [Crocinitomicaceae bacterium]